MTGAANEPEWHVVGSVGDIDDEDVMRFDHADATYAVYNTSQGYFATDGMCIELSLSGSRSHRPDGPKTGHALTFIVDHSMGDGQCFDTHALMSKRWGYDAV